VFFGPPGKRTNSAGPGKGKKYLATHERSGCPGGGGTAVVKGKKKNTLTDETKCCHAGRKRFGSDGKRRGEKREGATLRPEGNSHPDETDLLHVARGEEGERIQSITNGSLREGPSNPKGGKKKGKGRTLSME